MKTKNVVLLLAGIGLGYLAFKKYMQNKQKKADQQTADQLQSDCEKKWNKKAKTMRISEDALNKAKLDFMLNCTKSTGLTATV